MGKILLILSFIFFGTNLFSQGIVYINETGENGSYDLSGNIFYLVDSTDNYSFDQITNGELDRKFVQSEKATFKFNRNAPSVWYKINIQNSTGHDQNLVLAINNPLINDITFFNSFDSVFQHTGFLYPFTQRQVLFKNYLFRISAPPGESGLICFKVNAQQRPEFLPVSLMPEHEAMSKLRVHAFGKGLFYCIFLFFLFVIYNLWRSEEEKSYVYMLGFVVLIVLINLWRDGYLFEFIWPNSPELNIFAGRFLASLFLFFMLLFEYNYLNINKLDKFLAIFTKSALLFTLLFSLLQPFVKSYTVFYFGQRFQVILLLIVTVWGIIRSSKTKIPFFTPHVLALSLLVLELLITSFFVVESFGLGFYDVQISSIVTTLFFFTIVYIFMTKFKNSRIEVMGLNKNLELMVEKRTSQINAQKEELKAQHEELIQQKETLQNQREELRAKKELLELNNAELAKLSLVASKTDNLIYIFLPNGDLDWFNTSFSHRLGMSFEEYSHSDPISVTEVSANKNFRHVLNTCLREKSVVAYESKYNDENNTVCWYHTTLTPIMDDRDNIKYLIAIDTDITKLKQYEDELDQQKNDAEHQKNLAILRKEELEERQVEITDSIRYAKRIQTGIMPKVKQIHRDFSDSFVLFLPKDIVSGDFYWYHRIKDKYFVAAVDCTGHGVPGAFMSIIGTYLLNSIIIYNEVTDAPEILKQLNRKIKIALKSDGRSQTSDGMDIAIAIIDKNEGTVEFASALRPVYLFSKGDFIEIKGDKIPITSSISGTTLNTFTKHTYPFTEGDMFYLFSDGIIDQFSAKSGKKFLTKRFKQLLFEINPLSMKEQKEIIKKAFDDWRGDAEQVDDVLVMGLRHKGSDFE